MQEEHDISLRNRQQLSLSGVLSVASFDEKEISVDTELGFLTLKGQGLHITQLDLTGGKLTVDGKINALAYHEAHNARKNNNLIKRFLR